MAANAVGKATVVKRSATPTSGAVAVGALAGKMVDRSIVGVAANAVGETAMVKDHRVPVVGAGMAI